MIKFKNKILIYIPVYNAGNELLDLFKNLPNFLIDNSIYDWLIIDNCSDDDAISDLVSYFEKQKSKSTLLSLRLLKILVMLDLKN